MENISDTSKITLGFILSLSLIAVEIGFNIGVYHTVFYHYLIAVWGTSIALLFGLRFVLSRPERPTRLQELPLWLPSLWFIWNIVVLHTPESFDPVVVPVDLLLTATTVCISLPYIAYMIYYLVIENKGVNIKSEQKKQIVLLPIIIFILSILAGALHPLYLSCTEFEQAGDARPVNCYKATIE